MEYQQVLNELPALRVGLIGKETDEEILRENQNRWVIMPVHYPKAWNLFKKHEITFWTAEQIDYLQDQQLFIDSYSEEVRKEVIRAVAYLAISSDRVFGDLAKVTNGLLIDVEFPEGRAFLGFQVAFQNIQTEALYHMLESLVPDSTERKEILHNMLSAERVVAKKKLFCETHLMNEEACFPEKCLALCIIKSIFGLWSHLAIASLPKIANVELPALHSVNRFVGRDNLLHTEFAATLYTMLENSLPETVVQAMIAQAVALEDDMVQACDTLGYQKSDVSNYFRYRAGQLMASIGVTSMFMSPSSNPYPFTEMACGYTRLHHEDPHETATKEVAQPVTEGVRPIMASHQEEFSLDEDF